MESETPTPEAERGPIVPSRAGTDSEEQEPVAQDKWTQWKPYVVWCTKMVFLVGCLYAALFFIFEDDVLPISIGFSPLLLFLCSEIAGRLTKYTPFPPLLGMTVIGLVLRNLPGEPIDGLRDSWGAVLRSIALTIILLRGGMGLDLGKLKSLSASVATLTVCPQLVEAIAVAVLTHLLIDLPWVWAFLTGFLVAAVSPAVVVPLLLEIKERCYGTDKGIPSLVLAAAGLDDVIAISLIGMFIAIIFSTGSLAVSIIQGPAEVIGGSIVGILLGYLSKPIQYTDSQYRCIFVPLLVVTVKLFSDFLGFAGAGALAAMAYGAAFSHFITEEEKVEEVQAVLKKMWRVLEPILFGLVGAAIRFDELDASTIGFGVIIISISLVLRLMTSMLSIGNKFTLKERFFVGCAWIPKATVQAAMGPVPLDVARSDGSSSEEDKARDTLSIAVLAILITAPLGAVAIQYLAPRMLTKNTPKGEEAEGTEPDELTKVRIDDSDEEAGNDHQENHDE